MGPDERSNYMLEVNASCPLCTAAIRLAYIRLGAAMSCPQCGRVVKPEMQGNRPSIQYELTFHDFCQLLNDSPGDSEPLLRRFGHPLAGDDETRLTTHLAMQADPEQQGAIYRLAMTLWR